MLFPPDFLTKLEYLSIMSRRFFRSSLVAQRRSMLLGSGIEFSGGRYPSDPTTLLLGDGRIATLPEPLWPWHLAFASSMLVIDVALRRLTLL